LTRSQKILNRGLRGGIQKLFIECKWPGGVVNMKQMTPTPANKHLPVKIAPYTNLVDALEYAAQGQSGFNFYDGRGQLSAVLSYAELRDEAKVIARRLLGLGCERGARVGIIAETEPMFHRFFFACQYAFAGKNCPLYQPGGRAGICRARAIRFQFL